MILSRIKSVALAVGLFLLSIAGFYFKGRNDKKSEMQLDLFEDAYDREATRKDINRDSGGSDARDRLHDDWSR
jgi:hypothetical protein